jgi:hypothetical protein
MFHCSSDLYPHLIFFPFLFYFFIHGDILLFASAAANAWRTALQLLGTADVVDS